VTLILSWVDEREIIRKEEKKKIFLLIDRRSARVFFCVLLIADFSRSSSLEGISSAKSEKIIEIPIRGEREREERFSFQWKIVKFFSELIEFSFTVLVHFFVEEIKI
jgi:hypothetical protein